MKTMGKNKIWPVIAMANLLSAQKEDVYKYSKQPKNYFIPHTEVVGEVPRIVGTGKSRKKKSNKIHNSRMLKRKHAKNNKG